MYTTFYNLKHKPFQISTDTKFLWLGEKHEEALATLKYGVLDNKGFLLLTGDVGTGKTTLINALLNTLKENTLVATIRDPALELIDFYNYTAHVFGMDPDFTSKASFLIQFERFLLEAHKSKKQVLLIIDEAQRISQELLEEVRLLSNIEKEDTKLLNIFFVGQLEFNDLLVQPENMPIRQRITVNYNLEPLTFRETAQYISHRMKVAGATTDIFDETALEKIFMFSKGYPRLINIICDRCLLTGYVEETETIAINQVLECSKELEIPKSERKKRIVLNTAQMAEQDAATSPGKSGPSKHDTTAYQGMSANTGSKNVLYTAGILLILLFCYFFFSERSIQDYLNKPKSKPVPTITKPADPIVEQEIKSTVTAPLEKNDNKKPGGITLPKDMGEQKAQDISKEQKIIEVPETSEAQIDEKLKPQVALEKLVIPFPSNSTLPPRNFLEQLDELVNVLISKKSYWIIVNGFADSSGNEALNGKISEFRANAIKIYLVGKGLDESNITTRGFGSQFPIAPNDTASGRIANRRVEIEIK